MGNTAFVPRGRRSIPQELLRFGRHLVYCEGTKTEPYYIDNIKKNIAQKYMCEPNDVEILKASGNKTKSTVRLVQYAEKDVAERLRKGEHIDHVWIFFDKDDFTDFETACAQIAAKNGKQKNAEGFACDEQTGIAWHSCQSNESFELWLCLYYDLYSATSGRKEYIRFLENRPELKKIGFTYKKNAENIHDVLTANGGDLKKAIAHARKLYRENGWKKPSTGVFLFAEYFYEYMK